MKKWQLTMALICVLAGTGLRGLVAGAQAEAGTALRAAQELETVRGDLKGALAAYQEIVDGSSDRGIVAEALLRMAGIRVEIDRSPQGGGDDGLRALENFID